MAADPRRIIESRPFKVIKSVEEFNEEGPSKYGWHSTGAPSTCPEKARLVMLGVRKANAYTTYKYDGSLSALTFGSLWHYLLEADAHYKSDRRKVIKLLNRIDGIQMADMERIETMYLAYQARWKGAYGGTIVAVEARLKVRVPGLKAIPIWDPIKRKVVKRVPYFTVRLDKLVRGNQRLQIMEHKSAAHYKVGETQTSWRTDGQVISQACALNLHPWARKQGGYYQTLMDITTKASDPEPHRDPILITRAQQQQWLDDYRKWLVERARLLLDPGPTKPWRRTYQCWGRYGPCEFLELCHMNNRGLYEGLPE